MPSRGRPIKWRNVLLMLVILPFWTSFLLRVYALDRAFMRSQRRHQQPPRPVRHSDPLTMLQTDFAVYVGIVYTYLPFMILPLYTNLVKLDHLAARGGRRPRRAAGPGVPDGHPPALAAGHRRRLDAGVHPGHRGVRHPDAARRTRHADDRPRACGTSSSRTADWPRGRRGGGRHARSSSSFPILLLQRAQRRRRGGHAADGKARLVLAGRGERSASRFSTRRSSRSCCSRSTPTGW
jgi:hypothetical protein